jgi:hypothetical protein
MRSSLTLFAAACAASFALSTSAATIPIRTFSEATTSPQVDYVRATTSGSTTTLSTVGPVVGTTSNSIPITFSQLGTLSGSVTSQLPAFETFMPSLTSNSAPGGTQSGFNGTIIFSAGANGTGTNYLTAVIQNGTLTTVGSGFSFIASTGTGTVTLTSGFAPVILAMGGGSATTFSTPGIVAIGLTPSDQTGSQPSGTFLTAVNGGTVSSVTSAIPEPASFLSASTAILAGLGCFGWSRRKSSKV